MDEQMEPILRGSQFLKVMDRSLMELRQKYGMKRAELEILFFLSRCDGRNTSTDIHRQLLMTRGHISQAVDSLCRKEYLRPIPDRRDRRYTHYEVTEKAGELVESVGQIWKKVYGRIFEGVSEEELIFYRTISGRIRKNMEALLQECDGHRGGEKFPNET